MVLLLSKIKEVTQEVRVNVHENLSKRNCKKTRFLDSRKSYHSFVSRKQTNSNEIPTKALVKHFFCLALLKL